MSKPLTLWIRTNWKILQEMGIPDHLTCLLRNLYVGQEETVRTGNETMDWFQIGKEYVNAVYCQLAHLTSMQTTSCGMMNVDEALDGIKIARRNISNFRYADDSILMAESEEIKSLFMKVKEESSKAGLRLKIQKIKIMASSPIISRQIDGEIMETVTDFTLEGFKITAGGDCSHEIKRCLLLGRKAVANLDSILKSRDITLLTKVHLVKAIIFQ